MEAHWAGGNEWLRTVVISTFYVDNLTTHPGGVEGSGPLGPCLKDGGACSNPRWGSSGVASAVSILCPFLHHHGHVSPSSEGRQTLLVIFEQFYFNSNNTLPSVCMCVRTGLGLEACFPGGEGAG